MKDFFWPPTLSAGSSAFLWPRETHNTSFVDLDSVQETSSILKIGVALSNWPHFNSAYVQGVSLLSEKSNFDILVKRMGQISKVGVLSWSLMMHNLF